MYVLNTERVFYDKSEGEGIVIDFTTGYYYCFNAVGSAVFEYLINGGNPQKIDLKNSSGLNEFINYLLNKEILQSEDAPYKEIVYDCCGINISEIPIVTEYDEVRNLILADPIDEVRISE